MNENTGKGRHEERDESTTAALLRMAGPRAEVPEDVAARVYERVFAEWSKDAERDAGARTYRKARRSWRIGVGREALLRWMAPVAVAASLLVAVLLVTEPAPVPVPAVGQVARIVGVDALAGGLQAGDAVRAGDVVSTGAAQGASLLLAKNESLRLGENTRLRVESGQEFTLLAGRVYADTGQLLYRDSGLVIAAGTAEISDVGTQFAVTLAGNEVDVAVREGRVDVRRDDVLHTAVAGERLSLPANGEASITEISPHAQYWDWAANLAPRFDIENKTAMDFLKWVARETGMDLVFASDQLRMEAMRTDLHGSVADFSPRESVDAVLATTNLNYRIEPGRIVIEQ